MSLELNEEIDIKSETIEEYDFTSSEIDIRKEAFEEQDIEFESIETSGLSPTLSGNEMDFESEVDPLDIGGEVATTSLLTKSIPEYSYTCRICNKKYILFHKLRQHLRCKHKVVDIEPYIKCLVKCFKCFECNETFAQQCDLLVHLLSHAEILHSLFNSEEQDSGTFVCKICGATRETTVKHVQHIKTVHLGLREYKCKVCNTHFSQKWALRNHFIFQHSEFESNSCGVCGSKYSNETTLKDHMLSEHKLHKIPAASLLEAQSASKKTFTCKVCDIKFESRSDINHHIRNVHEEFDQIKCPVCQKDFTCIAVLVDHLHAHDGKKEEQIIEIESIETSGLSPTLSGNEMDFAIEVDPLEINGEVATTSLLTKSISEYSYTCQICNKKYRVFHNLRQHLRHKHKVVDIEPYIKGVVKCFECNETFAQHRDLPVHLLCHAEILHSLFNCKEKNSFKFNCKICRATKGRTAQHVQHIKCVHLGLREYKCKVCNLYFSQERGLLNHFIFLHSEFESYSCVVCSSKYSNEGRLKDHMLSKHKLDEFSAASLLEAQSGSKKTFTCKVCDIKFESLSDIHQHIRNVHEEFDQIKCPVCQKYFTCIAVLIDHLHAHDGKKEEQIFEIESNETSGKVATTSLLTNFISPDYQSGQICSNKYRLQHNRSKHLRYGHKVNDVEPFIKRSTKCFVCNKTFTKQCMLHIHLLSHAEKIHPLLSSVKKDFYMFACKICGITKQSNSKVLKHVKSDHFGLKEYKCKVCSTYFTSKASLFHHFSLHHSLMAHFTCEVCSVKFSLRCSVKKHLLRIHKIDENSVASLLPALNNCKTSFHCKVCNVEFKSRCDFHQHITDVHEGVDILKCPVCQKDFTSFVKLINHIQAHSVTKEEQITDIESNRTSGSSTTLSGNKTDIKIEVDPVEIGGAVATTSLMTNSISDNSYTCAICSKKYKTKSILKKHFRLKHNNVVLEPLIKCSIKCFVCNKTFATPGNLSVHLLSHAKKLYPLLSSEKKSSCTFACKICGITQPSNVRVVEHIKSVHLGLKEYSCKVCSTYFTRKQILMQHFSFQHSLIEPFTCEHCSYKCSFKRCLKRHLLRIHKLDEISVVGLLPAHNTCKRSLNCKVCNVEFKSRCDFHQHISDVHEGVDILKCPVCQKDFTCFVKLINHLHAHSVTKGEKITEIESNGTSGSSTTLSGNKTDTEIDVDPVEIGGEVATTSLLTNSISDNSYTCAICGKKYKTKNILRKHFRLKHKNVVLEPLIKCSIKCSIKCFVCNKTFATQCSLSVHLLSHAKKLHQLFSCEKKGSCTFACKICGITQQSHFKVLQHIKAVHLGLKEYKCKVCNTYFTRKPSLFHHFSLHHSLMAPLACEVCSVKFSLRNSLKKHLLRIHKLDETSVASLLPAFNNCKTSFNCKKCDVVFKSRCDFHQHISDVHVYIDIFKCSVCQNDFTCIAKIINHIHTHSGTNHTKHFLFSCGMCEERFSTENDRSTHLVNFHNKSPDGSSGSSSYECDKCKKVFTCTKQLKKHIIGHLNSISFSSFKCDQCDMFGSYDNLKQHIAKNHTKDSSFSFNICKANFSSVQGTKCLSGNMEKSTFDTSQFENTELLVSPDTNIGIVRCGICKQDFDNPTSLKNHFIKIHKNNQKQTSLQQNRRERQKVSQREHRTAEYLKNRLGSSPVKPQLQQAMVGRKVRPDFNSTGNGQAEDWITKVKPCCVLLDRGEVTRYLARLDKREEGTVGSSPIEHLPPPLATPPVRVDPSHPCGRVRVTSDRLLSAATSNVGLVCNNIGPRAIVEPKQLCVVNSSDGEVSSNNCIKSENLDMQYKRYATLGEF